MVVILEERDRILLADALLYREFFLLHAPAGDPYASAFEHDVDIHAVDPDLRVDTDCPGKSVCSSIPNEKFPLLSSLALEERVVDNLERGLQELAGRLATEGDLAANGLAFP